VGINGAGKTTIAKLFSLLYDDYEGEIIINGKELREYDYSEIKGFFSYVFQDFAKYYISMRDNIAIGSSFTVEETALRSVLSRMDMIDFAERLPEGIDTNLGKIRPNGVNISGGEWQRIAISRALCSDAPILILDEPTAALDPISESNIYSLFTSISKEKTTIVITHRLGAARMADKIFVINNGCVEESDSHAELMAAGGLYAEMFESQRSWYNEQG
jgi:ATP-binding cassette subfamily B protein